MQLRSFVLAAAVITTALVSTGCATRTKMAFETPAEKLADITAPVYLMTATVKNAHKPGWQPEVLVLHVEKPEAKEAADRINFLMDDKAVVTPTVKTDGFTYLMRMPLPAGQYQLVAMSAMVRSFPIISTFFVPLHTAVQSGAPGVYYLGHVTATVRERKGDEFKAGPTVPLVDQVVTGAATGTFDITITDEWASDEALLRGKFAQLADVPVQKAILPPFDRAKAQKWWAEH